MKERLCMRRFLAAFFVIFFSIEPSLAWAAPSVSGAQREVDRLRTLAADKYEAANEANIRIASLERETRKLKEQESSIRSDLEEAKKVIGQIALQNYQGLH